MKRDDFDTAITVEEIIFDCKEMNKMRQQEYISQYSKAVYPEEYKAIKLEEISRKYKNHLADFIRIRDKKPVFANEVQNNPRFRYLVGWEDFRLGLIKAIPFRTFPVTPGSRQDYFGGYCDAAFLYFVESFVPKVASVSNQKNLWLGTAVQKKKLFDWLINSGRIGRNTSIKNFLTNRIIQWTGSGRDLFYMLEQLKGYKLKLITTTLDLGPFIKENFVDKNGVPFQSISQNKSGTEHTNKTGKPRGGKQIDDFLNTLPLL